MMVKPLLRLSLLKMAFRNLLARPGRTLLTLLGITLSVAVVLATDATSRNAGMALDSLFEQALGNAELQIAPAGKATTVRESVLEAARRTPGVRLAVPVVRVETVLPDALAEGEVASTAGGWIEVGKSVTAEGIDPLLEPEMRLYTLVAGRFPVIGQYEALVSEWFAEQNELSLDGELILYTPAGSETLKITGLLADEGAAQINGGDVVFVPLDVLQEIFDENGYSEINIQAIEGIGDDPSALAELKSTLQSRLGDDVRVTYPAARADLVPRMSSSYRLALSFLGIVTLFMSVFLIYNTFATSVVERTQEIGLLRAVGMQRRQVMGHVLVEAALLAVLGCLLGVAGGVFLSRGLMTLMHQFFQVEAPALGFNGVDLIKSTSVGFIATLLATLLPANQAARISATEALNAHGRATHRVPPGVWIGGFGLLSIGWLFLNQPMNVPSQYLLIMRMTAYVAFLMGTVLTTPIAVRWVGPAAQRFAALLYGTAGALGARNVQRSAVRTMATVASLSISLIMIINISSLVFVIEKDAKRWLDNAFAADLLIKAPYSMRESFASSLERVPGIQFVSPSRVVQIRVAAASLNPTREQSDELFYVAIEPAQFRQVGDKEFVVGQGDPADTWAILSEGNALFVSSVVAEEYDLQQGGRLSLLTRRGQQEFLVAGITTEFDLNGLVVTGTYADLKRFFGETGADQFTIKLAPGSDAEEVAEEIRNRFEEREGIQVQSTRTYKDGVMTWYGKVTSLFDVLALIAVIVGTVGLMNTMTMNVLERRREIGMLRALGSVRRQVVSIVLAEALIIGLVSALYGVLFGYLLSRALVAVANLVSGYELQYAFNVQAYLTSLLIALGVSQLATLAPAYRAAGINIVDALKQE